MSPWRFYAYFLAFRGRQAALVSAEDLTERDAHRIRADAGLREIEHRYRPLFENMLEGLAYCQVLFDRDQPHDFLYIEVNKAFEALTGLKNVNGRCLRPPMAGRACSCWSATTDRCT